jgi:DNA repair exonuclease SbcCD nuclease subunit
MEIFAGPEAQEAQQPGVLDADLFARFQIDYAALGHIHSRRSKNFGAAQLHYPGSARVWRRGEAGPRGVNVLTVNGSSIQVEFAPLAAAGEYRLYRLPVTLDGSLDEVDQLIASWRPADWVEIQLSGIVEDENAVAALQHRIESAAGSRTRILNIDRSAVAPLPGILSQPLARAFIDEWKRREPADERDRAIWLKARETGLEQIRVLLEARPC